jgi:hypothetical protein
MAENSDLDLQKIACLLCQRKFKTVEVLYKHVQKSNLHKENMLKRANTPAAEIMSKKRKREEDPAEPEPEIATGSSEVTFLLYIECFICLVVFLSLFAP